MVKLSVQGTSRLSLQEIFVVHITGRACVEPKAILQPTGLCKLKIPMTPPGIEPDLFRLVVQCLIQLCLRVLEKKHQLFFGSNLFNQRCQPCEHLHCNTNRCDNYGKAMFNAASCMLVPTIYSRSGYWK